MHANGFFIFFIHSLFHFSSHTPHSASSSSSIIVSLQTSIIPILTLRQNQPIFSNPNNNKIPPFELPSNPPPTWKLHSLSMATAEASMEKSVPNVQIFENEEDLSVSLAKYTAELSDKFAKERCAFTVVLSGGSLIKSLRKLVESPYRDSIDWSRWHVFWVDERVVPKDHDDSNYKLANDGFLSKVPIPPGQVYAINDALSAEGAADDYETCLKQLVKNNVVDVSSTTGFPKFDLMLLGMGPDGHVASLFPGHPLVKENQQWVTFIKDSPKPPPERITFTFPVINSSANIAMVVTGSGEADVISKGLASENSDALPFQRLSPEDAPTAWFMDKAAASKL